MKKLDRHLLREMLPPLLIGTIFVVLMFQANILIALYKNLNLTNVPVTGILRFLVLKTPEFLVLTLPIGAALASSLAMSRIIRESEMTAMRAAGVPIRRILMPVLMMGLVVSLANFFIGERLAPQMTADARKVEVEMGSLAMSPNFKSNVVISLDRYMASFGSVQGQGRDTMALTDIMLIERRGLGENTVILAPTGTYRNGVWTIESPLVWSLRGAEVVSMQSSAPMVIEEPISVPEFFLTPQPTEQSLEELRMQIRESREMKRDTTRLEVAFHSKFSVPASCFVFALSGAAMALAFASRGAFTGTLMSMVCVWLYFNLYIISNEILGKNSWLPPAFAAWMPNVILLVVGVWILRRSE